MAMDSHAGIPIIVVITEEGDIRFLVNQRTETLLTPNAIIRRASHVEPVQPLLRWLFHLLRDPHNPREQGRMAAFTRRWKCYWRVNLTPVGGPILPYAYLSREVAIDAEVRWLNRNFLK